jgi:trehalose/maltose hydrolase-like predicted phosphorylase
MVPARAPAGRSFAIQRAASRPDCDEELVFRLARRFEAIVFDWDGTAVPTRQADVRDLRRLLRLLLRRGVHLVIVTGTSAENVDRQLRLRRRGEAGELLFLTNRGSEASRLGPAGPQLLARCRATPEEDAALDRAAEATATALRARGLSVAIVSSRLNRRKIDLIPEPGFADPPKARIATLAAAVLERTSACGIRDLAELVELARSSSLAAGLAGARISSDVKHIEIGLTDKGDAASAAFSHLGRLGVSPGLVLIAGDEFGAVGGVSGSDARMLAVPGAERAVAVSVGVEPGGVPHGVLHLGGGPEAFLELLSTQVDRRDRRELPMIDRDPAWTLVVEGVDPRHERAQESLLALTDGRVGTRAAPLRFHPAEDGGVHIAGVYIGSGASEELIHAPAWRRLAGRIVPGEPHERVLDLRTGVLGERIGGEQPVDTIAFSSLGRPGLSVLRASGPRLRAGSPLASPGGERSSELWHPNGAGGGVVTVARQMRRGSLDRFAAYAASLHHRPSTARTRRRIASAQRWGFDRLLCEHRAAWGARWQAADIRIVGDDELQLAVRVALYHLIGAVHEGGEAAVGARGATGDGYRGHVFWDTDVFVLPFLAATCPAAARAIVRYRHRRLAAARAEAASLGRAGARFPWESAASGFDVTPLAGVDRSGQPIRIENGAMEEHIVADVAWAAATYAHWTGDKGMAPAVAEILRETARWWASRVRMDGDGGAHIDRVIGPDEYHVGVDDNAFTNVMARWNLRAARRHVRTRESAQFEAIAGALVDGLDPATRRYEQFAGFFDLEPIVIADLARRPIAADILLGKDTVSGAQVVKQADVLMLHHLVPEETAPESLTPNLDYYEPRTAHGSSLSPGVHAALNARAGRMENALADLRLAARIDLDDLTGTTAAGVHLAAMASTWQALVGGVCGMRAQSGELRIDPVLPATWRALEVPVEIAGCSVRVCLEPGRLRVESTRRVTVRVGAGLSPHRVPPGGLCLRRQDGSEWEPAP